MNRIVPILAVLCLSVGMLQAQELKLTGFSLDPSDTYAVAYPVKDANGKNCGLIRLGLVVPEATFQGDIIKSEYQNGEWLVYMIDGANWITVMTPKYLPMTISFDTTEVKYIQTNQTYVMKLEKPKEGSVPTGALHIECKNNQGLMIQNADVYVDGEKVSGVIPRKKEDYVRCTDGAHEIEIRANGYNIAKKTVNVVLNKTQDVSFVLYPKGTIYVDGVSYEMIRVTGGSYRMGTEKTLNKNTGTLNVARPHGITLRNYSIGATEVSNALWNKVMGSNPSTLQDDDRPVTNVSYEDCLEFIKRLNQMLGANYRLPTEAEWEFAARTRATSDGTDIPKGSVYDRGSKGKTICPAIVYECGENSLKIKGLQGNVAEWCSDWFGLYPTENGGPDNGYHRVVRGGSFRSTDDYDLYGTTRSHAAPFEVSPAIGFRLAMDD